MKDQPLFSILIANYNNGKYLMDAIESVRQQTYTHWEIIIVDDCSTDNSPEIYQTLEPDPQIRIYYNEQNRGCGYTKRFAVSQSIGSLFAFLDSDDRLVKNALEIMVDAYHKDPNCSIINSKYVHLTNENHIIPVKYAIGPQKEYYDDLLLDNCNRLHHFAVFNRSFYNQTDGIDATLRVAEDWDVYLKMEEVGKIGFVNEILYYYRIDNENSVSLGDSKQKFGRYTFAIARLHAYERRYREKLWRIRKFAELYPDYLLYEVKMLQENTSKCIDMLVIKYLWFYLKISHFSATSIKRIIKFILYR